MARDEKLVYSNPIVVPLGDVVSAVGAHCKNGTFPTGGTNESRCENGEGAYGQSANTPACSTGYSATGVKGPNECNVGYGATAA